MMTQLAQHPLADDWVFGGVVKNVDFPEAQQDFTCEQLRVGTSHDGEAMIPVTIDVNEFNKPGALCRVDLPALPTAYCVDVISALTSRSLAVVAALAVSLAGLLPSAHVHADDDHQIVHRHVIGGGSAHHDEISEHHDAAVGHADHLSARLLTLSYDVTGQFALAGRVEVPTVGAVPPDPALGGLPPRTRLLPTHDPPLRHVSSPAPPAVV